MTEPPIQAPPNWRPAGRETTAAGIVRQFKEDIWNASELVRYGPAVTISRRMSGPPPTRISRTRWRTWTG